MEPTSAKVHPFQQNRAVAAAKTPDITIEMDGVHESDFEGYYGDLRKWLTRCGVGSPLSHQECTQIDRAVDETPKLMDTVAYIVCAVIFNEKGEVLLIQEAKPSCKGAWYLPAGKVEHHETFHNAVAREVKEESGLLFKPTQLMLVESQGARWHRLTYTGVVTGGTLKTPAQRDSESIQANWFDIDRIQKDFKLPLRACDVIRIVQKAISRREKALHGIDMWRLSAALPIPHCQMLYRILMVSSVDEYESDPNSAKLSQVLEDRNVPPPPLRVLLNRDSQLPILRMTPTRMYAMFSDLLKDVFGTAYVSFVTLGILAVEHQSHGKEGRDGVCMTLLMSVNKTRRCDLSITNLDTYQWLILEGSLYDELKNLLSDKAYPPVTLMA